ncbi:DUF2357 domain-containing protein [Bremerella alba]|uniref:DUF2357 domain-containing protein n=1 Tax=Bremerella alba TaxID=980252 RepID=A0A7V9AA61_9BACT|nr:DUF2357 domain-containing protein [Bremerella alba]MBA2117846.1 hypothetical protein [Bremerella alba]
MLKITNLKTGLSFDQAKHEDSMPVSFLHENGSYRIEYKAAGTTVPRLFISEVELPASFMEVIAGSTHIRWDWYIEEYAGEAVISLIYADEPLVDIVVDIAPNPYKLGVEIHRELLLDLQDKAEGIMFGTTPAGVHLQEDEAEAPPIARFSLLRCYFSVLERAFRAIADNPHRSLIAERDDQPLHKVRRVDAQSLRTALKRMPVLAMLKGRSSGGLATLDVPRREHTHNTSPNRHLLGLIVRLALLCSDLASRFEAVASKSEDDPMAQERARRWAHQTAHFQKRLAQFSRADFLGGLRPGKPDTAALLTVARHPAYSRFDQISRRILNAKVALGGDIDKTLGLRPTYDIYEYWCFFTVADAVRRALPKAEWRSNIAITSGHLLLEIENGSSFSTTVDGLQVSVTFQKSYGKNANNDGHFSISKKCIPDIVLILKHGNMIRTIIFDAKYRSGFEAIRDALSEIHIYRDAIRTDPSNSAIHSAFILTPSHHDGQNRYYTGEYRQEFNFGGFDLLPRNDEQKDCLVDAIRGLIDL